jgi:hypothetical protein
MPISSPTNGELSTLHLDSGRSSFRGEGAICPHTCPSRGSRQRSGIGQKCLASGSGLLGTAFRQDSENPQVESLSRGIRHPLSDAKQNRLLLHIADPDRGATSEGRGRAQAVIRENCSERPACAGRGVVGQAPRQWQCPLRATHLTLIHTTPKVWFGSEMPGIWVGNAWHGPPT